TLGGLLVQAPLDLAPRLGQLLLEVLHDVEAVDGHPERLPEHLLGGVDVAVPPIRGDLLQLGQEAALVLAQVVGNQVLVTPLQDVQDPLVGVVDEHRYELPVPFFSDNSSIPRLLSGLSPATGALALRSA